MKAPTRFFIDKLRSAPARRRFSLRGISIFTALTMSGSAIEALQAEDEAAGNHFERQFHPVGDAAAGEWWKDSWRAGWTYEHSAVFSLSARARVANKEDVNWWQAILGRGAEQAVGELNLAVNGNSLADSGVVSKEDGEILLTRFYKRVDVNRELYRTAIGDQTILDKVLVGAIDQHTRAPVIRTLFASIGGLVGTQVGQPQLGAVAGTWLGTQADIPIEVFLKGHGIQAREDGGQEISPDSSLVKGTVAAEAANLALQLSEGFNRRIFVIRAAADYGDAVQIRQIFDEMEDLVTLAEKSRDPEVGPDKAAGWLRARMLAYNVPEPIVQGTLQRESFALASDIFDATERKPNDVWVVPADFFNSFLHPDLKGRFRGNVVLRYHEDASIPSRRNDRVVYDARVIEILRRGEIDGRIHESTMEYSEPRFTAKLRSDTVGTLFVDKADGYLRQADLMMKSDTQAGLPDMKILNGFEVRGGADFQVKYDCTASPPEQHE